MTLGRGSPKKLFELLGRSKFRWDSKSGSLKGHVREAHGDPLETRWALRKQGHPKVLHKTSVIAFGKWRGGRWEKSNCSPDS